MKVKSTKSRKAGGETGPTKSRGGSGKNVSSRKGTLSFHGTYTAIVTPFRNGIVDLPALKKIVRAQVRAGVDGIVPVGTTGESPALDYDEHIQVIEACVEYTDGEIKVLAGTGANSTSEAIYLTQAAEEAGAHGSLQVAPYYNKPSQEGLFQHFKAIALRTGLPIVLYSIPGRCGVAIEVDTVKRLASTCANIVAIKEAGGSADRVSQLRSALGPGFAILSGDDSLTLPFLSVGGDGVISVASNIIPRQVARMVRLFQAGDIKAALKLHLKYYPLFKDLFVETNPVPIKAALAMLGQVAEEYRLPLTAMSGSNRDLLRHTMKHCGLLK
jgi:4-hydroxy-tetrahydrodipicolinate synthase